MVPCHKPPQAALLAASGSSTCCCERLCTIFSAPDYPQFIPEGEPRYGNKGAYALLEAPDYADPTFVQYEATLPRPDAQPYYDMGDDGLLDSDEEFAHDAADHSAAFMSDLDMSDHD